MRRTLLAVVLFAALPAAAFAQASITGVVRDTSGAVLPGVTVEASSPALIEKVRSVIADGGGQYRIVDLRPGTYTVTFTLPGFSQVRREGIELTGNFTATVNIEMRVGALEETVTVSGAAPLVDVQGVTRQRVMSSEVIEAIPTGRYYANLGVLIPGVTLGGATTGGVTQDVGGTSGDPMTQLQIHGSRPREQRIFLNGISASGSAGGVINTGPNLEQMQEMAIDTSGADASVSTGGVRVNMVPKEGGNVFRGSLFFSGTNEHLQGTNLTDDLRSRGLPGTAKTKRLYDIAPTFGGPIAKDKLWFFLSWRRTGTQNYVVNRYQNVNALDPSSWTYAPDLDKPAINDWPVNYAGARLTVQATPRNKVAASFDLRDRCVCPNVNVSGGTSLEAGFNVRYVPDNVTTLSWSSPVTNKLLMEAGVVWLNMAWGFRPSRFTNFGAIQAVEQAPPPNYLGITTYRGGGQFSWTRYPFWNTAYNVSYVTGAHALKAGFNNNWGFANTYNYQASPISSFTLNRGVPVSFTVNGNPRTQEARVRSELGLYIQDKYTFKRLTLSGGLRFDYMNKYSPAQTIGPAPLLPTRNLSFPETPLTGYKDISPRMGASYDLFGDSRTAIKVTVNRYVADSSLGAGTVANNPANLIQNTATRSWVDGNNNFVPDCDLINPGLQDNRPSGGDLCGAYTGPSVNFGRPIIGTINDPDVDFGWGNRGYNWEYSTSVQHQLSGRVAMDVGYFRRWYGNFTVTDNLSLVAADFDPFSVTVPTDSRLETSGETITGLLNINPSKASAATDNRQRFSKHYGEQYEYWHGVDVSVSARTQGGVLFQGGTSTGRTLTDNCEVLVKVPETNPLGIPYCHQATNWLTQVKVLGSYTVPRADVQVSGTFQSLPGPSLTANYVVANALVQPSLGRPLSGNAANVTVNVIPPGTMYGDRLNQVDLRFAKNLRFGQTRVMVSADLYNILNENAVLLESTNYSSFRTPSAVMAARLLKFTIQANF